MRPFLRRLHPACPPARRASPARPPVPARAAVAAGVAAVALASAPAAAGASFPPAASEDPGASRGPHAARPSLRLDPRRDRHGGEIPSHFLGFSIEWSLIERYMGPSARPGFANLLGNLGTGVLRIGGGSQDTMRFDATAQNDERVITPEDLAAIRATLDAVNEGDDQGRPRWGTLLGTGMAPKTDTRTWVGPDHARRFVAEGVLAAFPDGSQQAVAGIELGNEPDLSYRMDAARYLADFDSYAGAGVTRPFAVVAPNTSEPIAPWASIRDRTVPTRFFWDWPALLDAVAPTLTAAPGPFGAFATDHFYPMARGCATDAYRCATIPRLLSRERLDNFNYGVHTHASEAARRGLELRVEELNTAAGRGVRGVSDVAASAVWALDTMFNAACPQPPDAPGANAECAVGAIGVNFHNAEVQRFFAPQDGNAYYNAVLYDPTPAIGAPRAAPEYYALLLFAQFAQDTTGLRPVPVELGQARGDISAWTVDGPRSERRLFLINKSDAPVDLTVAAPGAAYELSRMAPHDPTGAGRTLDAPAVRIDGREVAPDGTWPGFSPIEGPIRAGRFDVALGTGEAVVVSLHGHAG